MAKSSSDLPDTAGARGAVGIVASVAPAPDGKLRLIMDDVACAETSGRRVWSHRSLFTFNDYSRGQFAEGNLSERELADIGLNVVARLSALLATGDR